MTNPDRNLPPFCDLCGTRHGGACAISKVAKVKLRHPAAVSGAMREKLHEINYDLFPFQETVEAYGRVAEHGAKKYDAWNWSKGLPRIQIICSLLRHTFAYLRGEERDKDSGLLHTDHILWNAVALSHNVYWNLEDGRRVEPPRAYKEEGRPVSQPPNFAELLRAARVENVDQARPG